MKQKLQNIIKKSKADFTEIRIEKKVSTKIQFRGKLLEMANSNQEVGGFIRCLIYNKGWGISIFNSIDDIEKFLQKAYESASLIKTEKIGLAQIPPIEIEIFANMQEDFRKISLKRKKELVEKYNKIILEENEKIKDTSVFYADVFTEYYYANSEGTYIKEEKPYICLSMKSLAKEKDNVQIGMESIAKKKGFEAVLNLDNLAKNAAKKSVDLLSAQEIKADKYTVICNPKLAGVFIHEAFGHLSEADHIYENEKAREMMVLGKKFGSPILNVFDDGSKDDLIGGYQFDQEGVKSQKTYLINNGILTGRLHSRETAFKMNEKPTGNARAISYAFSPIVRMTNTAIEQGKSSFEEMIKDIKLGVYACDYFGGQTMLEKFSFSSAYAYMIRNGKIEEMVKNVVLSGNIFSTLSNIEKIGNDFKWFETAGGCGKQDQSPLPTVECSPHIRIKDVIIGGK
ncbi:MAG: TldD/PmbA family protein [bacterium]